MTKRPTQTLGAPDAAKDGLPPGADKESGSGRPNPTLAMTSAIQGREEEFGRAVNVVLKTMADTMPYKHYFNDAVIVFIYKIKSSASFSSPPPSACSPSPRVSSWAVPVSDLDSSTSSSE